MTKVNVENINGRECTVIRKPFDAEWVKEQLAMGVPVLVGRVMRDALIKFNGTEYLVVNCGSPRWYPKDYLGDSCLVTILPALPRNPTEKDLPLLYRYMAEGIKLHATDLHGIERTTTEYLSAFSIGYGLKLAGATMDGQRVDIAITDGGE